MSLRLKFTFLDQTVVLNLPAEATWQAAHDALAEKLHGLPPLVDLSAKSGFPSKAREVLAGETLKSSGISSGSSVSLSVPISNTSAAPAAEADTPTRQTQPGDAPQQTACTPSQQWACPACTFLNELGAASCAICGSNQPAAAASSQVSADVGPGPSGSTGLTMERVVVPADNNCLYTAVAWLRLGGYEDKGASMRQAAAQQLQLRAHGIADAMLDGMSPAAYRKHLLQQDASWGGAFELQLLAAHFGTTFVLLNIQSGKQLTFSAEGLPGTSDGTPEPAHDGMVSFVLYDGLHFDAVGAAASGGGQGGQADMQRTFPLHDASATAAAGALVESEHARRAFTDVTRYTLRCLVCQAGLTGNEAAVSHAQSTGHTNFAEYS